MQNAILADKSLKVHINGESITRNITWKAIYTGKRTAQIDKIIFMLYTLNYRTLPGTKNCREKYETKVKENSNEKTGRLFKESILSLNEDRAEEKQDPRSVKQRRDQCGIKPQVRERRVL